MILAGAKQMGMTLSDAQQKILKQLIEEGKITVDSLKNPANIIEMVQQQSQQKSGPSGPSGGPSGVASGVASGGPSGIRNNKAIKQQQKYKSKYQSWDQKKLKVPVRPQVKTKTKEVDPSLKAKVLAKAKKLGPPFQQRIEGAVNNNVPLKTIINMIPGGVEEKKSSSVPDSTITKEEVYRKAFFLSSGQKQKVHDALKRGTKPSLVASRIPETYDVPFKSVVLGSAVAAMALSVLLA